MRLRVLALAPIVVAVPSLALAATRTVGQGKTYPDPCAAIAAAQDGDVIEVDPGTYTTTCSWSTDNLTIRGVGGRPTIDLTGKALAGTKGIFVIAATNATIENLEMMGARLDPSNKNGAGIRHEGTNLTVRGCWFHDNDDGILGSPKVDGTGDVVIESSEFSKNGYGDGQSHNMYLNHYASFTLTRSYSHDAVIGHLVKSRAARNIVAYNRITDETGTASYEMNFPNAGLTYVVGNLVQQSATTDNPAFISYGEEGASNADHHLFVVNNTFVNDRAAGGTFVTDTTTESAVLTNNLFVGKGTLTGQANPVLTTNLTDADGDPKFVDRAAFDYHLSAGSVAIDKGTAPGTNGADPLAPAFEYAPLTSAVTRKVVGTAIDVGAYEFGNQPSELPDGGGTSSSSSSSSSSGATTGPDAPNGAPGGSSSGGGGDDGCGCSTPGGRTDGAGVALALGGLALALARARRRRS